MAIYRRLEKAYQSALNQANIKRMSTVSGFEEAEQPVQRLVNLFRAGGGYGAGQKAIIEQEAKKGLAGIYSNLVSTGMSSGTNVAGARARVTRDTTTAKLGVEDARVGKLAEALGLLSQVRGQRTSTLANIETPSYGPLVGALTSAYGTKVGAATTRRGQTLNYMLGKRRIASSENIANMQMESQPVEKQHFNTPW